MLIIMLIYYLLLIYNIIHNDKQYFATIKN
jgi:hypothetical protein